jgi:hypothetical protein
MMGFFVFSEVGGSLPDCVTQAGIPPHTTALKNLVSNDGVFCF